MEQRDSSSFDRYGGRVGAVLSRRVVVGSSGLAVLGLLAGSAFSREQGKESRQEMQERFEESRAYMERLRNAGSMEERMKILEERSAADRRRAVADLKEQLDISDKEWAVVRPRLEKVYNLVHPARQLGPGDAPSASEVQQRSRELRELLAGGPGVSPQNTN